MKSTKGPLGAGIGDFSPDLIVGEPVKRCTDCALMSMLPCNLTKLVLRESNAEPQGKEGERRVEFKAIQRTARNESPVSLRSGRDTFQLTAPSKSQGPRRLTITSRYEAQCGKENHTGMVVGGDEGAKKYGDNTITLELNRKPLLGDAWLGMGFFTILNACWQACQDPVRYTVESKSCGLPTGAQSAPADNLLAVIELYPADKYRLELSLPALFKPDELSFSDEAGRWKSIEDSKKKNKSKKIEKLGDDVEDAADELRDTRAYKYAKEYLELEVLKKKNVRSFVEDMKLKLNGKDDEKYLDQIAIEFTQQDGERLSKAPIQDVVSLVRAMRSAEYRFKELTNWIKAATIGPGVRFSVDCQFLAGSVSAEWCRQEYIDDRVYLACKAELKLTLIKFDITIQVGWKCAGVADLFIELGGAGNLSISASGAVTGPNDGALKFDLVPEGVAKVHGKIVGSLMWAVKGEVGIECEFKAELKEFAFMSKSSALGGTVRISRGAVHRVITFSCSLWTSKEQRHEIIPEDPEALLLNF